MTPTYPLRTALERTREASAHIAAALATTQPDSGERALVSLASDAIARLEQALDVAVRADADGAR